MDQRDSYYLESFTLRYVIECLDGKEFLLSLVCVPICKEISRIGEQATLLITLTRHCLTKSLFS